MLKLTYCSLYKYIKPENLEEKKVDLDTRYLFVYPHNIEKLYSLNIYLYNL